MTLRKKISKLLFVLFWTPLLVLCSDPDKDIPIFLNVQSGITFSSSSESKEVVISTNAETWSFTIPNENNWVTVDKDIQNNKSKIIISVTENSDAEERSAVITITAANITANITVKQLGSNNAILVSTSRFTVPALGGGIQFDVTSNVEYEILVPDSVDWIQPVMSPSFRSKMTTETYRYKVLWSKFVYDRSTEITLQQKGGNLSNKITILQKGQDGYKVEDNVNLDTNRDIKVEISSASATSSMSGGEIEKSFDGEMTTLYHSDINNSSSSYFPITLDYFFVDQESIDYFIYRPREDNSNNGNFQKVDIYVSTKSQPEFVKIKEHDFKGSSVPARIEFEQAVEKPKAVRFVVKSGAGAGQGYASCAEMEFYRHNPDSFDPATVFTDATYSELLPHITESHILSIGSTFYKNLAYYLYIDKYPKEFRVQEYKAWPHPEDFARDNKISPYSLLDNPTGIRVNSGDELIAFVGDTYGYTDLKIKVQNLDLPGGDGYNDNSSFFPLQEGANKIKVDRAGLVYVLYHTEEYRTAHPIKIHFATGEVNGYFDSRKHQKSDWTRLLNASTDKHFDVVGKYAHITFPTQSFKAHTPDGLALIQAYDSLVYWEQDFMGFMKYDRSPVNRAYFHVMYHSFMYATAYRTAYVESTMKDVMCDLDNFKRNCWGPAHELGHINQTRPGFKWSGMTEVSNNVHSMYVQRKFGTASELMKPRDNYSTTYEKAFNNAFVYNILHPVENDVFCKLVSLWQLQLYFGDAAISPDFYKDLYEQIRVQSDKLTAGEQQLNFVKIASEVSGTDLTDYFYKWGYLSPVDEVINDYGEKRFVVTQSQVDKIVEDIKALNLPKPEFCIEYICDANWQYIKNRAEVKKGSASKNGSIFTMEGWQNVMAYEVWNDGDLIFVGNSNSFNIGKSITSNMKVYAVDYKGDKIKVDF